MSLHQGHAYDEARNITRRRSSVAARFRKKDNSVTVAVHGCAHS